MPAKKQVEPKLKTLHTQLVDGGYAIPADYSEFEKGMRDTNVSKELHRILTEDEGLELPEYEAFSTELGLGDSEFSLTNQVLTAPQKKSQDEKSKLAGMPDSKQSSAVAAQTAPEAYSREKKKSPKEQKADEESLAFYDQTVTESPVLDYKETYKKYLEATGRKADFDFRSQKITAQDIKGRRTSFFNNQQSDWSAPEDVFNAKNSEESYALAKEAYKFKRDLLSKKGEQINSNSPDALDAVWQTKADLEGLTEIVNTGQYNGKDLTFDQISQTEFELGQLEERIAQEKSTPEGKLLFDFADQVNSLDSDESQINETFASFISEEKAQILKQQEVDKIYEETNIFGKASMAVASPLLKSATGLVSDILRIPELLSGDKHDWAHTWGEWVGSAKQSIDNKLFWQPSKHTDPRLNKIIDSKGGNIQVTDDDGKFSPDLTLPDEVSINYSNIIPSVAKGFGDMVALSAPAGLVSKGAKTLGVSRKIMGADIGFSAGLMGSSYVASYQDIFDDAIANGFNREEAAHHARTGAFIEGSLELVSPQKYLAGLTGASEKSAIKALAGAGGRPIIAGAKYTGREIKRENIQELGQSLGGFGNQLLTNQIYGKENFEVDLNKVVKEGAEVIVLTSLLTGAVSGSNSFANPIYAESVHMAANDPRLVERLMKEFKEKETSPDVIKKVLNDIGSVTKYGKDQVGYVNLTHNIPITKEQAEGMIANGNLSDLKIYNDSELDASYDQKAKELALKRNKETEKAATKIVKNSDGTIDIVLKSDPTKKVGSVDAATGKITRIEPVTVKPIETKNQTPAQVDAGRVFTIDELIRNNEIALVTEEQAKIMSVDTSSDKRRLGKVITNIVSTMAKISPKARLVMLNSEDEAKDIAKKLGYLPMKDKDSTVKGFYDRASKTAFFVNDPSTAIHESVIHPIIDLVKQENPEVYQSFIAEIGSIAKGYDKDGSGVYYLGEAKKNYNGKDNQNEEAIVSFLTDVANGKFTDKTGLAKIINAIKKFLGVSEKDLQINLSDPTTLYDFAEQIAGALKNGRAIEIKPKPNGNTTNTKGGKIKFSKESSDKKISSEASNSDARELINNTKTTQDFFTDVVSGTSDKYKPVNPYKKLLPETKGQKSFNEAYSGFKGNFDEHIATSIPAFRDVQVKKGQAIIDMLPAGGTMVDIAGSEGGLNKAITKLSDGKIKTFNLDVNQAMKVAHESSPVEGAEFVQGSFLQDYEEDGTTYKRWAPSEKVDVVHETMGFQFMSPQRAEQFAEVANNFLKDDGVFITEEKVGNKDWDSNEVSKDKNFKSKYYTAAQIEQKNKDVKVSDFDANEGMAGNMVTEPVVLIELHKNFNDVRQYWDGGNFRGYIASNDSAKLDLFMESMGSSNSDFSNKQDDKLIGAKKLESDKAGKIYSTNDPVEFRNAIAQVVSERPDDGLQVDIKSIDEYQEILDDGGKLYLSEDRRIGAFVKVDGYMGSLFKSPSVTYKGVGKLLQDLRISDGGTFFDAFAGKLETLYIRNGFKPVGRIKFDETQAPLGWENTDLKSRPDNVFYIYDPNSNAKVGDGEMFTDWSEAYEYARELGNDEKADQGGTRNPNGEVAKDVAFSKNGTKQSDQVDSRKDKDKGSAKFTVLGNEPVVAGLEQGTIVTKPTKSKEATVESATPSYGMVDPVRNSQWVKTALMLASGNSKSISFPFNDYAAIEKINKLINKIANLGGSKADKAKRVNLDGKLIEVTSDVIGRFKEFMKDNLRELYSSLTPEFIGRSKMWYVGANRIGNNLANKYSITLEQAGAILGALSPQSDWFNNISTAERVMKVMSDHGDTKFTKELRDKATSFIRENATDGEPYSLSIEALTYIVGKSINEVDEVSAKAVMLRAIDHALYSPRYNVVSPEGVEGGDSGAVIKWNSDAEIAKAITAYLDQSEVGISKALGYGNKVRNFYNNIVAPNSKNGYITVDTHATSAALLIPAGSTEAQDFGVFGRGNQLRHELVKEAYAEVAEELGILGRELQSVLWEAQRTGINDKNRTEKTKDVTREIIRKANENNISGRELAKQIIQSNRSTDTSWGGGIRVQKESYGFIQEVRDTDDSEDSNSSLSGGLQVGRAGRANPSVGLRPTGEVGNEFDWQKDREEEQTSDVPFSIERKTETVRRAVQPEVPIGETHPLESLHQLFTTDPDASTFMGTSQESKEMMDKLAAMPDQQALNALPNMQLLELKKHFDKYKGNDNFGILVGIDLLKRAEKTKDTALAEDVFNTINKVASGMGQLFVQLRQLKTLFKDPNSEKAFIMKVLAKKYKKEGIDLPDDLKLKLENTVGEYVNLHKREELATEEFANNPTHANLEAANKLSDVADQKYQSLLAFIDTTLPIGVMSTAMTILKGNMLTHGSVTVNVLGNVVNAVNHLVEGVGTSQGNILTHGKATGAAMSAFSKALLPALKQAFARGSMRTRDLAKFEVQRQLQPAKAWHQLWNPSELPKKLKNKDGKMVYVTTADIYAEKLLEGTFGWPAAIFYRLLYLTDTPFKEAAKTYAAVAMYNNQKQNGNARSFEDWMKVTTLEDKRKIELYGDKFTYTNRESVSNKVAGSVMQGLDNAIDNLNDKKYGKFFGVPLKVIKESTFPYVGVPSNVVQQLLELALPPLSLLAARQYAKKGNKELAGMMTARAALGAAMYATGYILANAGLMVDSDDDKQERNDASLKHTVAKPSAINLSGLMRLFAGEDTAWKEGDELIDVTRIGISGIFLNYYANLRHALGEKGMAEFHDNMIGAVTQSFSSITKTAVNMSFARGAFDLLSSIAGGDGSGNSNGATAYTAKSIETLSNIVWPNEFSQLAQAGNAIGGGVMNKAYDRNFLNNVKERMAKREFYFGAISKDSMTPTLDIWGRPVATSPSTFLNPLKGEIATDPVAIEVFNLIEKNFADNPLTIATGTLSVHPDQDPNKSFEKETSFYLDEKDYVVVQGIAGRYKRALLQKRFNDPKFQEKTDEQKLKIISAINDISNKAGKDIVKSMIFKEIKSGNIVFDQEEKTYKRKIDVPFDPKKADNIYNEKRGNSN